MAISPATFPLLKTVTSEQSSRTSSSLWETKITDLPSSFASRCRVAKRVTFCGVEIPVVGSSKINTSTPRESSRTISNCCLSPTVRVFT